MVPTLPVLRLALLCTGLSATRVRALDYGEHAVATTDIDSQKWSLAQDEHGELFLQSTFHRLHVGDVDVTTGVSVRDVDDEIVPHKHKPFPIDRNLLIGNLDDNDLEKRFPAVWSEDDDQGSSSENYPTSEENLWPMTVELEAQLETLAQGSSRLAARSQSHAHQRKHHPRPRYSFAFVLTGSATVYAMLRCIEMAIAFRRRRRQQCCGSHGPDDKSLGAPLVVSQAHPIDMTDPHPNGTPFASPLPTILEQQADDSEEDVEAALAVAASDERQFHLKQGAEDSQMDDGWS